MNKDCVSLETARKLREKGWDQFNAHRWFCDDGSLETSMTCGVDGTPHIAAPSIGELLEKLPLTTSIEKIIGHGPHEPFTYRVMYDRGGEKMDWDFDHPNPSDALALLWLALMEKGIV